MDGKNPARWRGVLIFGVSFRDSTGSAAAGANVRIFAPSELFFLSLSATPCRLDNDRSADRYRLFIEGRFRLLLEREGDGTSLHFAHGSTTHPCRRLRFGFKGAGPRAPQSGSDRQGNSGRVGA
jgi:hypothetical protein